MRSRSARFIPGVGRDSISASIVSGFSGTSFFFLRRTMKITSPTITKKRIAAIMNKVQLSFLGSFGTDMGSPFTVTPRLAVDVLPENSASIVRLYVFKSSLDSAKILTLMVISPPGATLKLGSTLTNNSPCSVRFTFSLTFPRFFIVRLTSFVSPRLISIVSVSKTITISWMGLNSPCMENDHVSVLKGSGKPSTSADTFQ